MIKSDWFDTYLKKQLDDHMGNIADLHKEKRVLRALEVVRYIIKSTDDSWHGGAVGLDRHFGVGSWRCPVLMYHMKETDTKKDIGRMIRTIRKTFRHNEISFKCWKVVTPTEFSESWDYHYKTFEGINFVIRFYINRSGVCKKVEDGVEVRKKYKVVCG